MKKPWWNMIIRNKLFLFKILASFYVLLFCVSGAAAAATYEASAIPWSGYWWPMTKGGLATGEDYRGHPAPLEKYEILTSGTPGGDSINWYLNRYYDPDAVSWGGLCPAWARAAMSETYDILPSSEENIIFRVGDKKGLLVLCHDGDEVVRGYGSNDPVAFHRWLLNYIKDQGMAFTADLSFGSEVWYYPIYRYDMDTTNAGSYRHVDVKIYYATDAVHPDYIGTKTMTARYTYRLKLENGSIVDGEWTGDSVDNHPEGMKFPISAQTQCPYIDCGKIRTIAKSKDDFLEGGRNERRQIQPGNFNLVLLNKDSFVLDGQRDDLFYVELIKQDASSEAIDFEIVDGDEEPVLGPAALDSDTNTVSKGFTCTNPPYTIRLSQENYETDPNIYTLSFDRKSDSNLSIPYRPIKGEWSGFALTHTGDRDEAAEVSLVTYDESGSPIQTVFGPEKIRPGEKRMLLFGELDWRRHEYSDSRAVKVLSDRELELVNLFASPNEAMAGFGSDMPQSDHIVIADTFYTFMGRGAYMKGAVINNSFKEVPVELRLFSADGDLKDTIEKTLPRGENLVINPGKNSFSRVADGGWINVVAQDGAKISGYQYVKDNSGKMDILDTLPALPVKSTVKYLPHIPKPAPMNKWQTELVLINPTDRPNRLTFHHSRAGADDADDQVIELDAYEKRFINATRQFGKLPGDALYRSILKITGQRPFTGYYTYHSTVIDSGDKVGFALLDEETVKNELIMPHVPDSAEKWWTGISICNPNPYRIDVTAVPYDYGGVRMDGYEENISLKPGAYMVSTAADLFSPALIPEISFVKLYPKDSPDALIGGFYLYGNKKDGKGSVESLSGANM
ncbi:MAG: hypothetical protein ACLFNS_12680 [Desulfobacterales bacterium]